MEALLLPSCHIHSRSLCNALQTSFSLTGALFSTKGKCHTSAGTNWPLPLRSLSVNTPLCLSALTLILLCYVDLIAYVRGCEVGQGATSWHTGLQADSATRAISQGLNANTNSGKLAERRVHPLQQKAERGRKPSEDSEWHFQSWFFL